VLTEINPTIEQSKNYVHHATGADMRSSASLWNEMCGMIAGEQSFRARTVSLLQGPLAAVALATPHAGTFARAG
jgi:hypothetical protein